MVSMQNEFNLSVRRIFQFLSLSNHLNANVRSSKIIVFFVFNSSFSAKKMILLLQSVPENGSEKPIRFQLFVSLEYLRLFGKSIAIMSLKKKTMRRTDYRAVCGLIFFLGIWSRQREI